MERLSADDAKLLALETDLFAVHGLTIGVFEGPEPAFDDLIERVNQRIPLVPRYRQRLIDVPFDLARPVWVDDPHFSINFHVRHTALPERRSGDALAMLVSRLMSQRLDRGKPLWELWMVSGLRDGHWALVSKVHYAMIDGVSGTDLFGLLLDDIYVPASHEEFAPDPLPSPQTLIPAAIADGVLNPIEVVRSTNGLVRAAIRSSRRTIRAFTPPRQPRNSFDVTIGPNRRWQRLRVSLDDIRSIREAHECSTTDVILAAITGGIRHYLIERGEAVPRRLDALVPLAISSEFTSFRNEISALKTSLPIGTDDPILRLATIAANNRIGANNHGAVAGSALRHQDQFSAPTVMALGVRSAVLEATDIRSVDTIAVNVPGPAHPESILGHELLKAYPVVPLAAKVRMAFAVMSYCNDISFGITADWDSSPDLHLVGDGIALALDELRS